MLQQRDRHGLEHQQMKELALQLLEERDQHMLALEQVQDRGQEVEQVENREQALEEVQDLVISTFTLRRTRVNVQEQEAEEEVGDSVGSRVQVIGIGLFICCSCVLRICLQSWYYTGRRLSLFGYFYPVMSCKS